MKAHCKGCAGPAGQPLFSAQILAIGGEKQLSRISQAEPSTVAVMGRRDPLLALVLRAFANDRLRSTPESTICADFY